VVFPLAGYVCQKITHHLTQNQQKEYVMQNRIAVGVVSREQNQRISVGLESREKIRVSMENGLLRTLGFEAGESDHNGLSLTELARESLRMSGQSTGGNVMEMVGRAMTTADFPALLANTANKSLAAGYETASETWRSWCSTSSVANFKLSTLVDLSGMADLDQISESQPYQYGAREDAEEQYQIATYGKMFAISRQTIINDDLGALTDIPRAHGEAAARKIGDLAYAQITQNPAMRDGLALFHASHGNIGTSAVISEGSIGEAIKLMKLQKDSKGRALMIQPRILLAPVALEGVSEIFFASNQFSGDTKGSTRANIYGGNRFVRVYDSRLDEISQATWYLLGDPRRTVRLFFLDGQQEPFLDQMPGWSVDGIEYKVRIDCGAKAVDWKALVKNAGA
jgi:phage major head subunit gpT-like protein